MNESAEVNVKKPAYPDLEELYDLIKLSTSGRTELTIESLKQMLFERYQPKSLPLAECDSRFEFEFELKSIQSNKPVAQVFVAEVDGRMVGYIICHYHYSPWIGHGINVDDIYVCRDVDKRDLIERKLVEDIMDFAKQEGLSILLFDSDRVEFDFIKSQCKWYRNNKDSDWSLLQISSRSR